MFEKEQRRDFLNSMSGSGEPEPKGRVSSEVGGDSDATGTNPSTKNKAVAKSSRDHDETPLPGANGSPPRKFSGVTISSSDSSASSRRASTHTESSSGSSGAPLSRPLTAGSSTNAEEDDFSEMPTAADLVGAPLPEVPQNEDDDYDDIYDPSATSSHSFLSSLSSSYSSDPSSSSVSSDSTAQSASSATTNLRIAWFPPSLVPPIVLPEIRTIPDLVQIVKDNEKILEKGLRKLRLIDDLEERFDELEQFRQVLSWIRPTIKALSHKQARDEALRGAGTKTRHDLYWRPKCCWNQGANGHSYDCS